MQAIAYRKPLISEMKTKTEQAFRFKQFSVNQEKCGMKVGTDGILLGAWADLNGVSSALDIGTGSGLIALMLAQRATGIRVDAVEIDSDSCHQAAENFGDSPWSERLNLIPSSIQDFCKKTEKAYDLIVSNPPFFTGGTFSSSHNRQMVRHTVKLPHGDLLASVRKLLAPEGRFCLILPLIEGLRFIELASHYNLHCVKQTSIRPKANKPIARILLQLERKEKPTTQDELVIQKEGHNEWTDEFMALTGDFYLNM